MIDYHKLEPKRGVFVIDWWRMVIRWAMTLPVVIGPNLRTTQTPLGLKIRVKTGRPISTPFQVARVGEQVRISPGLVEDESPWIETPQASLRRINRLTSDGERVQPSEIALDLSDEEPNEDQESAVVVVVRLRDGKFPDPSEDASALQIMHFADFGPARKRELAEDGVGFQVLAKLRWEEGRVRRLTQVVRHHLAVSIDADGRLFFSAV